LKDAPPVDPSIGSNLDNAKKHLSRAIDDIKPEEPNPIEYRTLVGRAEIALLARDLKSARGFVGQALDANPNYVPARAVEARLMLLDRQPEKALALLEPILKEPAAITPSVQLTLAEALIVQTRVSAKDRDRAKQILIALKDKPGVSVGEIGRIAALIDPELPDELDVPAPDAGSRPKRDRRRGR
jgi:uncharacterized membrane-anchored protein